MKNLFLLFALLFCFTACEMHSEYNFNKDYSGDYSFTFDMSELMALGEMAQEEADSAELNFELDEDTKKDYEAELNSIKGISNAEIMIEDGVMNYNFNFEQPEDIIKTGSVFTKLIASFAPEDSLGTEGMPALGTDDMLPQEFEYSKKSFFFKINTDDAEIGKEELEDIPTDFFKMKFTFSFKRKIKKVDIQGFEIASQTDKRIVLELPLTEMSSDPWLRLKLK